MDPEVMYYVYLVCFLIGGTAMLCQFVLGLIGLGGHHDLGGDSHDVGGHDMPSHDVHTAGHDAGHDTHHHGANHAADAAQTWLVGVLTFRTIVAGLTFFGLAGLAGRTSLGPEWAAAVAFAAGVGALFIVAWIMRSLAKLQSEGTVRMDRAVGHSGTVYLTIPGHRSGPGKVHLNLQNRTVECQAITPHETIPTGAKVVVTAIVGRDTVEVAPAP
jgi:membrane protein implicated in regulation of membrane protease activity